MTRSGRLTNKIAIVTGAASGIGQATAELFVREGASVIVADRDSARAAEVAASLAGSAISVEVDVTKSEAVVAMVETAMARFGRIDVLVNNAGFGRLGSVVTTTEQDWEDVIAVNLRGVFLCSRHVIPVMQKNGGGAIVNIASTISVVGIPDRAAYVAAKGGVAALTRAMALDHASVNIRVNSIAPGVVESRYFDDLKTKVDDPEAFIAGLKARSPLNRMCAPAEIATGILYLASDEASFATGSMLTLDGGYTAR